MRVITYGPCNHTYQACEWCAGAMQHPSADAIHADAVVSFVIMILRFMASTLFAEVVHCITSKDRNKGSQRVSDSNMNESCCSKRAPWLLARF